MLPEFYHRKDAGGGGRGGHCLTCCEGSCNSSSDVVKAVSWRSTNAAGIPSQTRRKLSYML
jgi:hypothetical protein